MQITVFFLSILLFPASLFSSQSCRNDSIIVTKGENATGQFDPNTIDTQDAVVLFSGGKLKVLSYKELNLDVKLVPVNGNRLDEKAVEEYLNSDRLYGGLGIRWRVSSDSDFPYVSSDLESEGSGFFSRFTEEMKVLNASCKLQRRRTKVTESFVALAARKTVLYSNIFAKKIEIRIFLFTFVT